MRLKSKLLDIGAGGPFIVVLNPKVIKELDLQHMDRVRVMAEKKYLVCVVNISEKVREGEIGIFDEVREHLGLHASQPVTILPEDKPASIASIRKKMDGQELTKDEIYEIVTDIVDNRLTQPEIAFFISAAYTNGMTMPEVEHLTKAVAETGEMLRLDSKAVFDKHSIGGVPGNRTSILIVPIVAAAGLYIPKTSSRSITDPAGTADAMEVLAPVSFSLDEIRDMTLKNYGCLVWGGALDIAPADDDIIAVEQPLLLDPTPILLSSILAKKHAIGATHVLFDIPFGPGAKCDKKRADELGNKFLELSRRLGMQARVIKTDGSQPIGNGLGAALEARDVLWILEGDKRGPQDLRDKSCGMAGILLEMGGAAKKGQGKKFAEAILNSGRALRKMKEIIRSQGGDANIKGDKIQAGQFSEDFKSQKAGIVKAIDNNLIKRLARLLGAPYNKGSGLYLYKHIRDRTKKGEKLFTLYAESGRKLSDGVEFAEENQIYMVR